MNTPLANYVIRHYAYLMTKSERRAYHHLMGTMKATGGRSDVRAQEETRDNTSFQGWLSKEQEILQLAGDGMEAFVEQTAARILTQHGETCFLNYCPRCRELARSPRARQCRFCGLDWHGAPAMPLAP